MDEVTKKVLSGAPAMEALGEEGPELETLIYDFISQGEPDELGSFASAIASRLELYFSSQPYADRITGFEGYIDATGGHMAPRSNGETLAAPASVRISVSVDVG